MKYRVEISFKRALGGVIIIAVLLLVFQIVFWNYQRNALAADIKNSLGPNPDKTKLAQAFFEYKNRSLKIERVKPIINFNLGYNQSSAAEKSENPGFNAYCDYLLAVAGDDSLAQGVENQKLALDTFGSLGCGL